jgi:hypothetical protein
MVDNFIYSKSDDGRELFPQGEKLFKEIQTIARMETIRMYLTLHNYGKAYYNAFIMSLLMPENIFLQNAMAISVYGTSKHRHNGSLRDVLPKHTEIEGEMQQVNFFFGELNRKELSVLAVRLLWLAHKQSPENKNIMKMFNDAVKNMIEDNKLFLNDFSDYPKDTEIIEDSLTTENTDNQTSRSKYDRIKSTQTKIKPSEKFTTLNYMFVDLKQDVAFISAVQQVKKEIEDAEIIAIVKSEGMGKGIGSDGVLLLDPIYQFVRKGGVNFRKSSIGKDKLTKTLTNASKSLKLNSKNMQDAQLKNFDTEEYNSYCKLKDWLTDVAQLKDNMVFYQNEGMAELAKDLNCKYLTLTAVGVKQGRYMTYNKFQTLAFSALCPVIFPAYLGRFLAPRQISATSFVAIELETGKVIYADRQTTESISNQEAIINAFVFDCLYQLKNGGKK